MMENHVKEGLSRAYATAVAHRAGMNLARMEYDYGFDAAFREVQVINGRYSDSGHSIDVQLKSTVNVIVEEECIKYDLEVKNYNDLVFETGGSPRILVLLVLPKDDKQWLRISEKGLFLKKCAWWCSLKGMQPTKNSGKIRIKIPKSQILTPESLRLLMDKVKMGEDL